MLRVTIAGLFILICFIIGSSSVLHAQDQEEGPVNYFQMEPLNDTLFIRIQEEVFIDPPDPKAEIVVDLRDPANQTVTIKGALYPFLSFKPETRAQISTYPFKINLQDEINLGSVFTRVIGTIKFNKVIEPPRRFQISSNLYYINPYLQVFGGERFGFPIKQDIGISLGLGTPYSGPFETGFVEVNFHLLGFHIGGFGNVSALTEVRSSNRYNNIYLNSGYELGYVIPLGNFLEIGYMNALNELSPSQTSEMQNSISGDYRPKVISGDYINWEFRYPFRSFGSTRSRLYVAKYIGELHFGFTGREMTLAGSTFDFRLDLMTYSPERNPQYLIELLVQKIADSWATSAVSLGPSVIFSKLDNGNLGALSLFFNLRLKLGTSF